MSGTEGARPAAGALPPSPSVDSFLDTKLQRPPSREAWVDRRRLLERLDEAAGHPVVLVAAPAGFGKTTVVAQWLSSSRSPGLPAAWLSLDAGDNDPGRLWTHVAAALERAGCQVGHDMAILIAGSSGGFLTGVLPRLLDAMAAVPDDVVLVLDDFHFLHEPACHEQVEFLIEHLPPRAHLMLITRADPGLRLGRLRATGRLAELRAADLAFNHDEASWLLAAHHVQISGEAMARLMDRTEGWPAGLYLASLSLSGRSDPDDFVRHFSGGNRFIGDFLTEEVLSGHSEPVRDFILSISILDRFSPALCDVVVGATGSAGVLHELERTNMFLVPLDEKREWFRFHHLFAAVARGELEVEHPERIPVLHARAADWFLTHDHVDEAIAHLLASGDTRRAALLVQANWLKYVDAGRAATVFGWLDALGTPSIAADPSAGVTAAWMAALSGDEEGLSAHLQALSEFHEYGPLPDGTRSVESAIGMIQGLFGYSGPVDMSAGARRAVELETDGRSPYYSIANLTLGHAAYVEGTLEDAGHLLAKASDNEAAPSIIKVLALSNLALVEAERGLPERSRVLAEQAMHLLRAKNLTATPQATLAFTALAQSQAAGGNLTEAMETVQEGLALRRRNPAQGPWGTLHHLLVGARVAVEAGDLPLAQELLHEASTRINRYHQGMGPMRARLAAIQERMRSRREDATGEPLTSREIDVLRLLHGSLSLSEIARELYVSTNTVKTHTRSLYRKLGASSRTEAVRIAQTRLLG
jgi:LuxR family maltose regulon positive regulatory protein